MPSGHQETAFQRTPPGRGLLCGSVHPVFRNLSCETDRARIAPNVRCQKLAGGLSSHCGLALPHTRPQSFHSSHGRAFTMKHRLISVVVALAWVAIGFGALPASPALAGTCASQANGDWTTAGTWGAGCTGVGGIPTAGDNVTVSHTVALTAAANVGSGTVTVENGGILNLSSFALTANTLAISDGGEVQQGGTSGAPAGMITTRSYAPNSTYTFNGTQASLSGTHPAYGNLNFATTPGSAGTFSLNLSVAGSMTVNLSSMQEVRFATGATSRTHSIAGNLNVQNGIVVGNNGTGLGRCKHRRKPEYHPAEHSAAPTMPAMQRSTSAGISPTAAPGNKMTAHPRDVSPWTSMA